MPVKPIPDGYRSVTPYLIVSGAAAAIDFYARALGATERMRMTGPDGKVGHAEIMVGDSVLMLADEAPERGIRSPKALGGAGVHLLLYVEDVDTRFERAVAAGGRVVRPLADQFYGDRSGTLEDPFGHQWTLATHVEDVSDEEMRRRHDDASPQGGPN
jgi:PhnB protein